MLSTAAFEVQNGSEDRHYFYESKTSAKYILLGPEDYRKRVSIQFGSRPPRFMGVFSTEVAPQQVLVKEQEVKALLEKGAIEDAPHSNRETGLYSQYFIVTKKDGGVASHFRSLSSERLRHATQVQNVNFETNRATDPI